jgi:FkbM family methyltransferase
VALGIKMILDKLRDIFEIHKFFFESQLPIIRILQQLISSYNSTVLNSSEVLYLGHRLNYQTRFTPILLLTYPKEIKYLSEVIENFKPVNVIDVGANIGQWGMTFKHFYPKSNLYSYEPQKESYVILKQNATQFTKWFTFKYAIGNPKNRVLYVNRHGTSENSLIKSKDTVGKEQIKTVRLTPKIVPKNIDLLKLDAEGYEVEVIKNTKGLKISNLSIEIDVKNKKSDLLNIKNTIKKSWHKECDLLGIQSLKADSPRANAIFKIHD